MHRREWMTRAATVLGATSWLPALSARASTDPDRKRSVILLWMNGGPSTIDLFDLKPGHKNGGPFKEIQTDVPGLKIGELLPKLSKHAKHLSIIRSMSTVEGDHGRAAYIARTGNLPAGAIQYPAVGAAIAKELETASDLPGYVRICPPLRERAFGLGTDSGFLDAKYKPMVIAENEGGESSQSILNIPNLQKPAAVDDRAMQERLDLLTAMDNDFAAGRGGTLTDTHRESVRSAVQLMNSEAASAFKLDQEKRTTVERYGRSAFGQGCLLASRLVERGVPFVEVGLDGWDTHNQNFDGLKRLAPPLDAGWSALLEDLKERGLLETTTIIWAGEFGRTPTINTGNGRDHYPKAWSAVLAGAGLKGGSIAGKTSADGTTVEERPVTIPDLLATICKAIGVDPMKQNISNVGRPIRIVDKNAKPITEILA